ncbi:MAG: hypothetical protein A4E56_00386 [Pelotomaculum sp. PtaU1.Bin065]|nr:MAG: hypothetical protein A4E56_00386 [Pelotomaculum sp. PtaU1.Bin065]
MIYKVGYLVLLVVPAHLVRNWVKELTGFVSLSLLP